MAVPKLISKDFNNLQTVYAVSSGTKCADDLPWKPGQMIGSSSIVELFHSYLGAERYVLDELTYEGQNYHWKFLSRNPYSSSWYTEITGGGHWYRWVLINQLRVFP